MGSKKKRMRDSSAENDGLSKSEDVTNTYMFENGESSGKKLADESENRYVEILGYYKRIKNAILEGELLNDEENCETLVERMVEDMKKKEIETLLLTDQRCSKTFELILCIGILCVRRLFDKILCSENEHENELYLERLVNSLSKDVFILETVFREVDKNIFSMYGSHVTETALEGGLLLQNYIGKRLGGLKFDKVKDSLINERENIRKIIFDSVRRLSDGPGWVSIITDSSATHVGRTIMNICVGRVEMSMEGMEEHIMDSVGRRNQGSKLRSNENKVSLNSECYKKTDFLSLLYTFEEEDKSKEGDCLDNGLDTNNTISNQIYKALLLDLDGLINDTYGLPSLITLLKALNEVGKKRNKYPMVLSKIITLIITNGQEEEEDIVGKIINGLKMDTDKISRLLINCTNSWINCSLKSRLLEALLEIVPYHLVTIWTSSHTCSASPPKSSDLNYQHNNELLINKILDSDYGHFVVLNLLRSNVLRREEFTLILKSIEFSKLTSKKEFIDILIALIDTCRRLQCEYKYLTKRLWKVLEIETSEDYQYTFSCLIFLVKRSIFGNSIKGSKDSNKGNIDNNESNFSDYKISPQGCMMISSLSKFPAETIHPLISGITYFINNFKNEMKGGIVETNYGTRMVENILSSTSTIPTSIKRKWIQSYIGDFLKLSLNGGVCNYALIAMFYASDNFYRKIIVEELLNEEQGGGKETIMSKNFKIFKSLKIESFVKQDKNWYDINKKIDKTREMFRDIIEGEIDTIGKNEMKVNNKSRNYDLDDKNKEYDTCDDKSINVILEHIRKTNVNKRIKK
ncbi:hypothetical protein FG386_000197 [Cryptosporidium ryanae]|uniref:uncharacterized protein n=1 Tax=Cryptosporidium ryanae TaxID=515981 RepID=UPI00351A5735|nr:hypothetical protein FG386_000197 [Cryptosporidium ryanae]